MIAYKPNQIYARIKTANIIAFAITSQKMLYNQYYQPLFMKIREWQYFGYTKATLSL